MGEEEPNKKHKKHIDAETPTGSHTQESHKKNVKYKP